MIQRTPPYNDSQGSGIHGYSGTECDASTGGCFHKNMERMAIHCMVSQKLLLARPARTSDQPSYVMLADA
jgi:hypothetical protein